MTSGQGPSSMIPILVPSSAYIQECKRCRATVGGRGFDHCFMVKHGYHSPATYDFPSATHPLMALLTLSPQYAMTVYGLILAWPLRRVALQRYHIGQDVNLTALAIFLCRMSRYSRLKRARTSTICSRSEFAVFQGPKADSSLFRSPHSDSLPSLELYCLCDLSV